MRPTAMDRAEATALGHTWTCICGRPWGSCSAAPGGRWRGAPYSLDPWAEWCRENLPAGHKGVVYCADDGILRTFDPGTRADKGMWCKVEAKSRMATLGHADRMTLLTVAKGVACKPLVVRFDGDVPTFLRHWPMPCPHCGAPGDVPEPSRRVEIEKIGYRERHTVRMSADPEQLRRYLLTYFQQPDPEA